MYSIEWLIPELSNTKVTATFRKHLMGTIYKVNEAVYTAAVIEDVNLSTQVTVNQ